MGATVLLSSRRITCILSALAVLLVAAGIAGQMTKYLTGHASVFGLIPLFDLDAERNIPTYFASFILLFASGLLGLIATLKCKEGSPYTRHWAVLCFGFMFMSADEYIGLHERLTLPMWKILDKDALGYFYHAWVIPGAVVAGFLAIYFIRFLLHLSVRIRTLFVIAGVLYLTGVLGLELFGGQFVVVHGTDNLAYRLITSIEEGLEMAGVILFINALLNYVAESYGTVNLQLEVAAVNRGDSVN